MVPLALHLLLAILDYCFRLVAGQLLPRFYRSAFGVDLELYYADGCAEAAAVGAVEYAEYTSQRECDQWPGKTETDCLQPFLAGIFAGTLFWVGVRYITTVLPGKHCLFASIEHI